MKVVVTPMNQFITPYPSQMMQIIQDPISLSYVTSEPGILLLSSVHLYNKTSALNSIKLTRQQ